MSAPASATLLAAIAATLLGIAVPQLRAATTEQVVVDRNSGLAIHGFDPVAYFTDGTARLGRGEYEHRHAGAVWRFRNPGNLAAFAAAPEIYAPQFGGYDPIGVGRGAAVAGNPGEWLVLDDRLYLFHTAEAKAEFAAEPERALAAAEERWPAVLRTLSP